MTILCAALIAVIYAVNSWRSVITIYSVPDTFWNDFHGLCTSTVALLPYFTFDKGQVLDLKIFERADLILLKQQGDVTIDHVAFLHQLLHYYKRNANFDFARAISSLVSSILYLLTLWDSFDLRTYLVAKSSSISCEHTVASTRIQVP